MKRKLVPILIGICAMTLLSGCVVAFQLGGGKKDSTSTTNTSNSSATSNTPHSAVGQQIIEPTVGQQLLDLKKARDAGVISEQEYEMEKTKLLNQK
jgi:hypothetical protein